MVVNFISKDWELKHVMMGLFEAFDTFDASMILQL
jgi:hypothetical protein